MFVKLLFFSLFSIIIKCDDDVFTSNVPEEVRNLTVVNLTSSSVTLHWERPRNTYELLNHYSVYYELTSFLGCDNKETRLSENWKQTNKTEKLVSNLKPYANYTFYVTAKINKLEGIRSVLNITTKNTETVKDKEVPSEEVSITVNKRDVNVTFLETNCSDREGILKVKIKVTCKNEWCENKTQEIELSKSYMIQIKDLKVFSEYDVEFKFCRSNDLNSCNKKILKINFTTDSTAPTSVNNASVYSTTNTSISLRWKAPYPPTANLKHFKITYMNKTNLSEPALEKNVSLAFCSIWKNSYCETLTNLSPNRNYSITIEAIGLTRDNTSFLDGQDKAIYGMTTIEKSEAPFNLKKEWSKSNDLLLNWTRPNNTKGPLNFFLLKLVDTNKSFSNSEEFQIDGNKNSLTYFYQINSSCMSPSTEYNLSLSVFNGLKGEELVNKFTSRPALPELKIENHPTFSNSNIYITVCPQEPPQGCNNITLFIFISDRRRNREQMDESNFLSVSKPVSNCSVDVFTKPYKIIIGNKNISNDCGSNNFKLQSHKNYIISLLLVNKCNNINSSNIYFLEVNATAMEKIEYFSKYNFLGFLGIFLFIPVGVIIYVKREQLFPLRLKCKKRGQSDFWIPSIIVSKNSKNSYNFGGKNTLLNFSKQSKPVKRLEFEDYVKQSVFTGELEHQLNSVSREQTKSWKCGASAENESKNRYKNLLPYDYNRVILTKINNDLSSDYINASYILDGQNARSYIATQNPTASTLYDFWRMIWENNVKYIVMLSSMVNNNKETHEKYWPEANESCTTVDIQIHHISTHIYQNYVERLFTIYYQTKTKQVNQLHFLSWPGHGIPLYSQTLTPLLKNILQIPISSTSPIVIHSSAGIGRTGTILLCDICLREAAQKDVLDVFKALKKLRKQRLNMVDNIHQYKLAHLIILNCLTNVKTSVFCNEINSYVERLIEDKSIINQQLQYLKGSEWQDQIMKNISLEEHINVEEKNRFQDIIPEKQGQIFLKPYPAENTLSSYINAVKVDGFNSFNRFIATQQPMQNTIGDFWRLVEQSKVSIVVSLNGINQNNSTPYCFWPINPNQTLNPTDYISITHLDTLSSECYNVTTVQIFNILESSPRNIFIITAKIWPAKNILPSSVQHFLDLWKKSYSLSDSSKDILVTCYDGVTACGLYVATSYIIDKINLSQICDVCEAVKTVRRNRNQFIKNEEQFLFLYKVAQCYINQKR